VITTSDMSRANAAKSAAARLRRAQTDRQPIAPVRELYTEGGLVDGYEIQRLIVKDRIDCGGTVSGRKIGLTSPAVQRQLGVDQPDFGFLFADMEVADGGVVESSALLQPKLEAEVALVLGKDLDASEVTVEDARSAVVSVAPALEIVDSRIRDWDITILDTVADNASSALYVLGQQRTPLGDYDLRQVQMTLQDADGAIVSSGTGADCLGDPLQALVWLAEAAHRFGAPLRAGDVILSGALGPMVPVAVGAVDPKTLVARYEAHITGIGSVSVSFAPSAR
jgi:2-keto-4-pentenoate hydratase